MASTGSDTVGVEGNSKASATGPSSGGFERPAESGEGRAADPASGEAPTELHLTRFFAAPRQMVFGAWTDAEIFAQWWGPKGFTNPVCAVDARPGGAIRVVMQAPDGTSHPMTGRFVEVDPPWMLQFTAAVPDANGEPIFETLNSVLFREVEGGTQVTVDVRVLRRTPAAERFLKGMSAGWEQSLEKLETMMGNV